MKFLLQILFIGGAITIFVLYINPTYAIIQQKQDNLKQLEDANKKAIELNKKRDQLLSDKNKITTDQLTRLSKMLPDGVENVRLIIDIKNITNEYLKQDPASPKVVGGVDKKTNTGTAIIGPNGKPYGTVGVTFGVTTTYDKFIGFLEYLEDNLRLVDITDISFTPADNGNYSFSIGLQTYWLK